MFPAARVKFPEVCKCPPGNKSLHTGCADGVGVVHENDPAVPCKADVNLDTVCPHFPAQGNGFSGVFRCVVGRAAMGEYQRKFHGISGRMTGKLENL